MNEIYHQGNRELQARFDSLKLADRLNEIIVHDKMGPEEADFIATRDMFFISAVDKL